jgi:UDP-glucuronate 4-epimerase
MSRYLVTGAAGFIGARVTALLLEQGHQVVGIDSLNSAYDVRLKQWRLQQLQSRPGFTFSRGDLSDRVVIETLWNKHDGNALDAVINLAARAGVRQSTENPYVYFETNVLGTLNLLELARRDGVKKFVLASTSSLYGAENPRPFREDACTDKPLSPYAASKKAAEAMCYTWHFLYGIDVTVLRYFTVYGPARLHSTATEARSAISPMSTTSPAGRSPRSSRSASRRSIWAATARRKSATSSR